MLAAVVVLDQALFLCGLLFFMIEGRSRVTNESELSDAPLQVAVRERGVRFTDDANRTADFAEIVAEYRAFHEGAGLVDWTDHSRVEISGRDRAAFLNNFCTNDVRPMQPGEMREAFLTSVQGKTLAHMLVFHQDQTLLLETVARQEARIQTHLEKYLIREDVTIVARTDDTAELLLIGPEGRAVLQRLTGRDPVEPPGSGGCVRHETLGELWIHRTDILAAEARVLFCQREQAVALCDALLEHGATPAGRGALELLRVEAGWPCFGRDFDEQNLPQEIGRDSQAISFTKGCYLGQETVARIDALGHVNRMLAGVRFDATETDHPAVKPPIELACEHKPVGNVTSLVRSPKAGALLGLAMLRTGHQQPGSRLDSPIGPATVVALPLQAD